MLATVSGTTTTFWRTWDLGAPTAVGRLDVDGNPLVQGNFSADGHWFVGRMSDGTTKLWDVARPARPILRTTLPVKGPVYSVAMSPDGRTVSVANNGRNLLFDMSVPTRPVAIADIKNAGVMTFSPDGRSLAAPASGGLVLWDVSDRAHPVRLTTLEDIPNGVRSYAFSANGKVVAVGNANGSTTLWDVTDRSAPVRLAALTGARGAVGAMAFSPDGMMLATGDDQTVALWDVEDLRHPRRLASLTRHNGNVTSVAFSPDARFLATDSPSDAVMLWDVTDRARPVRIGTLMHQVSFQVSASFSPDGRTLMTGGESFERTSTGTLWDYTGMTAVGADPAKSACAIAGRGFTADEWGRYIPDMPFQRTCSR
jgi:WD40 repeat protein